MDLNVTQAMWFMVEKLVRMNKWGGAHTELRNLTKGMPSHFTQSRDGKRVIEKALKELTRSKFLLSKTSTGEIHVSLNQRKAKEILQFYEKNVSLKQ